jgi:hypothetical protein
MPACSPSCPFATSSSARRGVVVAVCCAMEVQNAMVERNSGAPEDRRIEFRIGVHLGDVVEEADSGLMGDGVNIAARIENIAGAAGICLSEDASRQAREKLHETCIDLGARSPNNIVKQEDHDSADGRDDDDADVVAGDAKAGQKPADDRADDAERNVHHHARAGLVGNLARDPTGDQPEHDPADYAHFQAPLRRPERVPLISTFMGADKILDQRSKSTLRWLLHEARP